MQEQKDSLTYKTLALVINHEIKICHKNMEPHEWIAIHDDNWRDNNDIVYSPVFSRIDEWTYWTEPEKEFKPYSMDVWLSTDIPSLDSSFSMIENRLFHGVRYDYTAMGECKHKFKITVEKADHD